MFFYSILQNCFFIVHLLHFSYNYTHIKITQTKREHVYIFLFMKIIDFLHAKKKSKLLLQLSTNFQIELLCHRKMVCHTELSFIICGTVYSTCVCFACALCLQKPTTTHTGFRFTSICICVACGMRHALVRWFSYMFDTCKKYEWFCCSISNSLVILWPTDRNTN